MIDIVLYPCPSLSDYITYQTISNDLLENAKMLASFLSSRPKIHSIAANQIGLKVPVIAMINEYKSEKPPDIFINPSIVKYKGEKVPYHKFKNSSYRAALFDGEQCLSLPGTKLRIKRYEEILVSYYDIECNYKSEWFGGFRAVMLQHNLDMLRGVYMPDHPDKY
jgi:peptide deformylase